MFPGKAPSISPRQKSSAHNPCKRCRQQPYSGSNITLYRDDKCPERSVSGHKPLPAIKPSPGNPFGRPTGTGGGEVRRLRTQSTLTALRELPKKRVEAKKLHVWRDQQAGHKDISNEADKGRTGTRPLYQGCHPQKRNNINNVKK